jgi:hypothetical protein
MLQIFLQLLVTHAMFERAGGVQVTDIKRELELIKHNAVALAQYEAASEGLLRLWYEALRESDDYARALRGELGEPWASMAKDFGPLEDSFPAYWVIRGRHIFADTIYKGEVRQFDLKHLPDTDPSLPAIYVEIPLGLSRAQIVREFNKILDAVLGDGEDRPRPPKRRKFYKDQRLKLPTIKNMLAVWRLRKQGMDWQEIGEQLKLSPSHAAKPSDDEETAKEKRRLMIITTQRLHRMAAALIDFAARGDFPRVK